MNPACLEVHNRLHTYVVEAGVAAHERTVAVLPLCGLLVCAARARVIRSALPEDSLYFLKGFSQGFQNNGRIS